MFLFTFTVDHDIVTDVLRTFNAFEDGLHCVLEDLH